MFSTFRLILQLILILVTLKGAYPYPLGDLAELCASNLCPTMSSLSLWSMIQPVCHPTKLQTSPSSLQHRRLTTSHTADISISTFIVGLSCSLASVVGILVGANLGRMRDRYLALNALRRQGDDGYSSMRFQIERSNR